MADTFRTILAPTQATYKEKGSKFLAHAFPVQTEEEVKSCLKKLKKLYYDARHHCYAYIMGSESTQYRANDDGEPRHSAGDPILGQIRSHQLTNTLVVVVRYFGGTKLGVGGLINAYKKATSLALQQATITEKTIYLSLQVTYPYEATAEVMPLIEKRGLVILQQSFTARCHLTIGVTKSDWEEVNALLAPWVVA
ncbi:MAG: IMPACT family protein [Thermonemataceae bacterium]